MALNSANEWRLNIRFSQAENLDCRNLGYYHNIGSFSSLLKFNLYVYDDFNLSHKLLNPLSLELRRSHLNFNRKVWIVPPTCTSYHLYTTFDQLRRQGVVHSSLIIFTFLAFISDRIFTMPTYNVLTFKVHSTTGTSKVNSTNA